MINVLTYCGLCIERAVTYEAPRVVFCFINILVKTLKSFFVSFRNDYPCEMIPMLNVVLFKTADPCIDIREKASQLLQILER